MQINTDFQKLKRNMAENKVLDSLQFISNVVMNLSTLYYCKDFITALIERYNDVQSEYNNKINTDLSQKGNANIGIFRDDINLIGIDVGISFLTVKYIKDLIQYANNIFDGLAQVINCSLFANEAFSCNEVDYYFILNKLREKTLFANTYKKCLGISKHSEFDYLRKANNRVKHIIDLPTQMSFNLLGNDVYTLIKEFSKKNKTFSEVEITQKASDICRFVENSVDDILEAILIDLGNAKNENRWHTLGYYAQIPEEYKEGLNLVEVLKKAEFGLVSIDFNENDISKIPTEVYILFSVAHENSDYEVFNCDYDNAILRNNGIPIGYILACEPVNKDFIKYRKYTVALDGGKFFFEMAIKNTKMDYKPLALKPQEFTFVGKPKV